MLVYGIDFGYSNACIATLDNKGNPKVIPNLIDHSGELATVVMFESADNVIVGDCAKDFIETDGERVVQFVKRELGISNTITYAYDGRTYDSVEISALILKKLKQMAEEQGETVNDVVVAMPAYFGIEEKTALKNAVELAGLNLLGVISEPIAAALAYFHNRELKKQNILVYDLGGISLDISILQMSTSNEANNCAPLIKILSIGGSDSLGGKAWDDKLFDFIFQVCCDENGLDPNEIDVETRQLIRSRVGITKKRLSNAERVNFKVAVNGVMTSFFIGREDFENITIDLTQSTMSYVEQTLKRVNDIKIDTVLLVGGATRMPMIQQLLEEYFPGKVQLFEPEHAVAIGAAIYGQMLNRSSDPISSMAPRKVFQYSPNLIAKMIRYSIDHSHDDVAKELISEVDWERLTPEQLFDFFSRIRHLFKE